MLPTAVALLLLTANALGICAIRLHYSMEYARRLDNLYNR